MFILSLQLHWLVYGYPYKCRHEVICKRCDISIANRLLKVVDETNGVCVCCLDPFRSYPHAPPCISSAGATTESASSCVGLRSAQYTCGGAVYQADGCTIRKYREGFPVRLFCHIVVLCVICVWLRYLLGLGETINATVTFRGAAARWGHPAGLGPNVLFFNVLFEHILF